MGVIRRVDELGRIVLPVEIRRMMDISERDEMEILLEDDKITLRKVEASCVFCGATGGLTDFRGKYVCDACKKELGK